MSELDRLKRELCNFSSKYLVNNNESVALDCFPCLPDEKTKIARTFLTGIGFNDAMESTLCVVKNLKVAVTNDYLQKRTTPAVNTVKLAKQFLCNLDSNPFIKYCGDSNGFPVKYFVYLSPTCHKIGGFRAGNELIKQEIIAVDKHCRQYSIGSLVCPETAYIPDALESCDPNVTYLKALNNLEQFIRVGLRANSKMC
jgi:hypothetical protein